MNYLEIVQQKRKQQAEQKATKSDKITRIVHEKQLNEAVTKTVKDSSEDSKQHLEKTTLKAEITNPIAVNNLPDLALREDISKLVSAIKSMDIKPDEVKFDPVVSALKELSDKLDTLPKSFPEIPKSPDNIKISNLGDLKDFVKPVVDEIKKIKIDAPKVSVQTPEIDTTKIEELLTPEEKEEEFELKDFRGQDIDNNGNLQYIGMEAPDGRWCFIENDMGEGSVRYCFGKGNYTKEWQNHVNRSYRILSEAVNAV